MVNPSFTGFCLPLRSGTSQEARAAIKSGKAVVVKFHSPGCPSCREAAPEIQSAACPYRSEVEFVEINIDQDHELADEIKIKSIPFVAAYRGGQLVSRKVGAAKSEEYGRFLARLVKAKKEKS